MTVLHFDNARLAFKNFAGRTVKHWPAGKRYFYIKLSTPQTDKLSSEGWSVKRFHQEYYLCVHINEAYDTDVAHLDYLQFETAEVFIEGWTYDRLGREEISARLISVTPNQ